MDENTGLIAISQSGESADTLNAVKEAHRKGMLTLGHLPSLVIAPNDSMYEKNKTCIQEIKACSGMVIVIATEGNEEIRTISDDVIYIPSTLEMLLPVLAFIPMQLFAYYMAIERGNDVDKPGNLAKSVTVE